MFRNHLRIQMRWAYRPLHKTDRQIKANVRKKCNTNVQIFYIYDSLIRSLMGMNLAPSSFFEKQGYYKYF
jgi:hypothetical protein